MKRAFIVGLFDEVEARLRDEFSSAIARGDLEFLPLRRRNSGSGIDLDIFKQRLGQIIGRDCRELLLVIGDRVPRVTEAARQIVTAYQERCWIEIEVTDDLAFHEGLRERLVEFGLNRSDASGVQVVAGKLASDRVLCVHVADHTCFKVALQRAGLIWGDNIEDWCIPRGGNSNLNQDLIRAAGSFRWLLYAYEGLRTPSAGVTAAYKRRHCIVRRTATQVLDAFMGKFRSI